MSTNTIATPIVSNTEVVNRDCSIVCKICEGIGREAHPRSRILHRAWPDFFLYLYLHYPDPDMLRSSYKRYGCQTCRLMLSCIQYESSRSIYSHDEQAWDDQDRVASFDVAQDTCEAESLVKSAFIDKYTNKWPDRPLLQIEGCGAGRIALCIMCRTLEGPRTTTESSDVVIHVFETVSVAPALSKSMKFFCSPG